MDTTASVRVRGLRKSYGHTVAVDGVDLDIHHGEVFALLGPNGAGKTTTVEILEGYRKRDDGEVTVLGADPAAVTARRAEHARAAAAAFGCCVLLKGSTTVIAPADGGPLLVNPTGTGWLATAGTGDVLAGLAGALLAQGLEAGEAAAAAAYLHGISARYAAGGAGGHPGGEAPIGAGDVIGALPEAIRAVSGA